MHIENIIWLVKNKFHALRNYKKVLTADKAKSALHDFYKQPFLLFAINSDVCSPQVFDNYKLQLQLHKTHHTTYDKLISTNSDVSIRRRHLGFLVTEVFKSVNNLNPHPMWESFKKNFFPYVFRKVNTLRLLPAHVTRHAANSLLFGISLPCNNLPSEIKESFFTEEFEKRLKEHGALYV